MPNDEIVFLQFVTDEKRRINRLIIDFRAFSFGRMSTSESTEKKTSSVVVAEKIDSFDALLKTNNVFLFIPNIIGDFRFVFLLFHVENLRCFLFFVLLRLFTCVSFDCLVLLYANASENNNFLLFNERISRCSRWSRGSCVGSK